jgi:hypothetical protein
VPASSTVPTALDFLPSSTVFLTVHHSAPDTAANAASSPGPGSARRKAMDRSTNPQSGQRTINHDGSHRCSVPDAHNAHDAHCARAHRSWWMSHAQSAPGSAGCNGVDGASGGVAATFRRRRHHERLRTNCSLWARAGRTTAAAPAYDLASLLLECLHTGTAVECVHPRGACGDLLGQFEATAAVHSLVTLLAARAPHEHAGSGELRAALLGCTICWSVGSGTTTAFSGAAG